MTILNRHKLPGKLIPQGAVYIGRGSMWGNPFIIGRHGDRDQVCDQYEKYLQQRIEMGISLEQLASLHGKDLVCFCAPLRCHGETLVKLAAEAHTILEEEPSTPTI